MNGCYNKKAIKPLVSAQLNTEGILILYGAGTIMYVVTACQANSLLGRLLLCSFNFLEQRAASLQSPSQKLNFFNVLKANSGGEKNDSGVSHTWLDSCGNSP